MKILTKISQIFTIILMIGMSFGAIPVAGSTGFSANNFGSNPLSSTPYSSDPFYSFPFYSFPFYSFEGLEADPFYSFPFYSFPFYSFDFEGDPFYSFPFYSFDGVTADPFYSFPFYSFDDNGDAVATMFDADGNYVGEPFYSFPFYSFDNFGLDPFYSFPFYSFDFEGEPFYSFPFYSFDVEGNPFYSFPFYSFEENGEAVVTWFDTEGNLIAKPFYSFPFYSWPFYSWSFYSTDIDSNPFYSWPFYSWPFYSTDIDSNPFYSWPFYSWPFYSTDIDSNPFYSWPFYSWPFYSTDIKGIPFYSTPFYSTWDDVEIDFFSIDSDILDGKSNHILKKIEKLVNSKYDDKKHNNIKYTDKNLDKLNKELGKLFMHWYKIMKKQVQDFYRNYDPEVTWNVARLFGDTYVGDEFSNKAVQIAVLDSGIDTDHPDLMDNIAWTYDATGSGSIEDDTGHGTHVVGVIAAAKNGVGVAGVYADAEIYVIKTVAGEDMIGEWEWLEEAIYAAIRGPDGIIGTADDSDVINMSFGSGDEVPPTYIHDAIKLAYNLGIAIVAAAGNSGDGDFSTNEVNWPAMYPEVIAVGALNPDNTLAYFSNTGNYIEFVAPGDKILSTFLDGSYAYWGGTSMATPHVTGIVALLIAQYGHLPVGSFNDFGSYSIRGLLHSYATDLGTTGWDAGYGWGLVQFP